MIDNTAAGKNQANISVMRDSALYNAETFISIDFLRIIRY